MKFLPKEAASFYRSTVTPRIFEPPDSEQIFTLPFHDIPPIFQLLPACISGRKIYISCRRCRVVPNLRYDEKALGACRDIEVEGGVS